MISSRSTGESVRQLQASGKRLLYAKISRPRLFNVVPRERLYALLDAQHGRPLIWISGPPGAGKTTLIASYLERLQGEVLWYQVDNGDSDPVSLFHHLSSTLCGTGEREFSRLPRFAPEHHADVAGFSKLFFRALFAGLREDSILVLDNYQEAPIDAALHDVLREAVAETPPTVSIVAISRGEPPPSLVQLIANGAMAQIGWDELQLSIDEVRAIAEKRNVTDDWIVKALHQQSQGWAAGITLMLERLGHFDGNSGELPHDTRESVFHYFASLVFDQASAATRHILLRIAYMPRVTAELAIELSGNDQAAALLDSFYRRRLFTDRRSGPEPIYEFHALFQDFLRAQVRETFAVDEFNAVLSQSVNVLCRAGEFEAALELALIRCDAATAIEIILGQAKSWLLSGRRQTLLHWIERVPPERREHHPWLNYWRGLAEVQTNPLAGSKTLEFALQLFRDGEDRRGKVACLTALLNGLFNGFHALDSLDRWLDELLSEVDRGPAYGSIDEELRLLGALSITLFHARPWHPLVATVYRRIEELLPGSVDASAGLNSALGALVVCGLNGDFERGDQIARLSEAQAMRDVASPADAAWWCGQVGWLRFAEARYEEALDYLMRGQKIAEANGLQQLIRQLVLWRVTVTWRVIGWSEANDLMEEIEGIPIERQPMVQAQFNAFKSRIACCRKHFDEAKRWTPVSQAAALRTGSRLQELIFSVSNADVYLEIGQLSEALFLIEESRALIQRAVHYACWRAAPMLLEARYAQLTGDDKASLRLLEEALKEAERGANRYFLRFCDFAMPPLFSLALEQRIELGTVRDLIRLFRLKPPPDAPDNWPWPVRIVTLGRFALYVNGEPVEFGRKVPRKTLQLLKAIIAQGGRDVAEESLCDALWRDEEGDAARHVLSITVLRLRKLLGSHAAVLQHGGKISLNREYCWVDAWAFESTLAKSGFAGTRAWSLYGGTLLPEDESEPWTVVARERLRGKFIHALSEHGAKLETLGELQDAVKCYMSGIDADAVVEPFYQGLMRCYERVGDRAKAFSAYRRLKQTLSIVLGVPPSEASNRLFQKILDRQMREVDQGENESLASAFDAPIASGAPTPGRRGRKK